MPRHEHVVCPYCAVLCDDLTVEIADGAVVACSGCGRAAESFAAAARQRIVPLVGGQDASLDAAIARAVDLLVGARRLLVVLLGYQSSEAAARGAALAARLGGAVDGPPEMAGTLQAMAVAGLASATLGEVRNRADVVLCWRADPLATHPRLLEQAVDAPGLYRPRGRADRTLIVVGDAASATARGADVVLSPAAGAEIELLWALRAACAGTPAESPVAGIAADAVTALAGRLRGAAYGALFYSAEGAGAAMAEQAGLLRLVDELNAHSRWACYSLPAAPNAWGTAGALAAATGYGHAMLLEGLAARHNGAEFAAGALLASGAVDALLVVGGAPGAALPAPLSAGIDVPVVVVESQDSPAGRAAAVRLPVAAPGIAARGTMARLDRVALPLEALLPAEWPADRALLGRLLDEVGAHVPA